MKTYLVGGAVRDMLLGIKAKDKDWVVVDSTPSEMIKLGFIKIAANFPIFINPKTKDEYALARTETKKGLGYKGFETVFSPNTSLSDDLKRRDLTINSIAIDENNNITDPFNGCTDIKNRVLRHTSDAFSEDPLRVVRLARFKAQLSDFDFTISPDTILLSQKLSESGELKHLTIERLNMEFVKALHNPYIFLHTLSSLNALEIIFPYIHSVINTIENDALFKNEMYLKSSTEQKISLTFFRIKNIQVSMIASELFITNKQHNLLQALTNIHQIASQTLNADNILKLLKDCNILRNKDLRKNALNTYNIYTTILKNDNLADNLNQISDICTKLDNLNIQKHLVDIDKTQIKNTIRKLNIDTINNHIKGAIMTNL